MSLHGRGFVLGVICSAGIESGLSTCKKNTLPTFSCTFKKLIKTNQGMLAHAFNPIIWEAETERSF